MKSIILLPPTLISKISAGEVIERPGSVVKELVENALDAEATSIEIHLTKGGTEKIVVKDNGHGMSKKNLLLSFKPHTTSKIKREEDLFNIRSFGFRGEALASIATVSFMTIKSRQKGKEGGYMVELKGGECVDESPIGMPEGTEISVESLFYSTPARKKFLKEHATEIRSIIDIITRIALAHPHVRFVLTHNHKTLLDIPSSQTLATRIEVLLGSHIAHDTLPVTHENRYGKISGYIARPQQAGRTRTHQHLFVNNRSVTDLALAETLREAYGSLLEPRAYPPFVLFISLPYESVDVNIHPKKEEVSFEYPDEIKNLVQEAVHMTLGSHNLTYQEKSNSMEGMDRHTADILKELTTPWNLKSNEEHAILQIKNLYLVTMTDNGLLIVDQHAAHERILYEQFRDTFTTTQEIMKSYTLPKPLVFDISISEAHALNEHIEIFQKLGFEIESFGKQSFKLSAIPDIFKKRNYVTLITEVLQDILQGTEKVIDHETNRTLSFLACRSAIKAGDPLDQGERKKLIEKLLTYKTIYTCPHGRPTHIELPLSHLHKIFKRK